MNDEGACPSCGSELFLNLFLTEEGNVEAAVICPNCDQIEMPEDVIRLDERLDDD